MDYLFQDGGKPKKAKSKTTKSKTATKSKTSTKTKSSTKTGTKTTKSKTSTKKGGNFLGAVGELVAPSGWESFATTAGLFALDRADAALRRGKSEKSSAKKGGMDPQFLSQVRNNSGNIVNNSGNSKSNQTRLKELYNSYRTRTDKNSQSYKELQKRIIDLEEEIEIKKIRKQQKKQNNKIIRETKRFNEKTRNYVQDFIAGIFLPGEYNNEADVHFRSALRMSKGIHNEDELNRIIENAKKAKENRISKFEFTKAKVQLESMPYNSKWAYRR